MDEYLQSLFQEVLPNTLLEPDKFIVICRLLCSVAELEGDLAELGVWRGGVGLAMSRLSPGRPLHLFDTFCGLKGPAPGQVEVHHAGQFSETSADHVRSLFEPDTDMRLHVGWFPEMLTGELRAASFAFVHVDADYYESTWAGVEFFYPRLAPGGIMVFDDWQWPNCPGVERAVLQGRDMFGYEILEGAPYQVYVKKR